MIPGLVPVQDKPTAEIDEFPGILGIEDVARQELHLTWIKFQVRLSVIAGLDHVDWSTIESDFYGGRTELRIAVHEGEPQPAAS